MRKFFCKFLAKNPISKHLRGKGGNFFRKALVSGALGGAIAQFFASPTDLIKVQLQMEGLRRLEGLPPRYHFGIFLFPFSEIFCDFLEFKEFSTL